MEKFREVDNDELVDSVMAATIQCGLTVKKIVFENERMDIHIQDAERLISFPKTVVVLGYTLEQLGTEIGKQLDG